MEIIISCKNFELTPSLREYAQEKLSKLGIFWHRIIRVRLELEVDKHKRGGKMHQATVTVEVPGPDIRVVEQAEEMHAAIDLAIPVLERQIKKMKERLQRTDWKHLKRARDKFSEWYSRMRG